MSKKPKEQEEEKGEESTEEGVQVEERQMEETEQPEQPKEPEVVEMEEEVPAPETVEEEAEAVEAAEGEEAEEAEEAEEGEGEEEIEVVEERFYTVPFRKAWITPRHKRTPRTVRMLRSFVSRHMKAEEVSISNEVNEFIWSRSIKKPPRKLRIRAVKDKEGRVIVYPAEAAS